MFRHFTFNEFIQCLSIKSQDWNDLVLLSTFTLTPSQVIFSSSASTIGSPSPSLFSKRVIHLVVKSELKDKKITQDESTQLQDLAQLIHDTVIGHDQHGQLSSLKASKQCQRSSQISKRPIILHQISYPIDSCVLTCTIICSTSGLAAKYKVKLKDIGYQFSPTKYTIRLQVREYNSDSIGSMIEANFGKDEVEEINQDNQQDIVIKDLSEPLQMKKEDGMPNSRAIEVTGNAMRKIWNRVCFEIRQVNCILEAPPRTDWNPYAD